MHFYDKDERIAKAPVVDNAQKAVQKRHCFLHHLHFVLEF